MSQLIEVTVKELQCQKQFSNALQCQPVCYETNFLRTQMPKCFEESNKSYLELKNVKNCSQIALKSQFTALIVKELKCQKQFSNEWKCQNSEFLKPTFKEFNSKPCFEESMSQYQSKEHCSQTVCQTVNSEGKNSCKISNLYKL